MIVHVDRDAENPGRVLVQPEDGSPAFYATITRADNPTQVGTPMNKQLWDEFLAASGVTTGSATAYTLAQQGFQLVDGALIRFRLHVDSGATPTINVNGTGAKKLMASATKPMKAGIKAGTWVTAVYSTTLGFFVLQGSGSDGGLRFGNEVNQVSTFEWFFRGGQNTHYGR